MSKELEVTTALEIANTLGVHRLTINRIARENEIGTKVGNSDVRVFTRRDVSRITKLCRISKGNPNFKKKSKRA